jgi:hypothetical protein
MAKTLVTISHPPPTIEHPQSINNVCGGSESYTAMNCIVLLLNQVLPGQSLQSVLVYNFTNMHEMSYRSDFFAFSCIQYLSTRSLLYYDVTFSSLSSRITQHSKFYHQVELTIFEYLFARGYNLCQKWMCLYSWFERHYFANYLRSVVGFNEWRLEAGDCLE